MENNKTALFGYGVVGKQTARIFKPDIIVDWDAKKQDYKILKGRVIDWLHCKEVWICVPTPSDKQGKCDISLVEKVSQFVVDNGFKGDVIIRSTVIPGTTKKFIKKFPNLSHIISYPEFLRMKYAKEDTDNPWAMVLGCDDLTWLHDSFLPQYKYFTKHRDKTFAFDNTTAEMAKYANNTLFSTLVVFANQIYDACQKSGANYADIWELLIFLPWQEHNHLDVKLDGYRGYDGHCLPKDTLALAKTFNLKLLKYVDKLNQTYLQCSDSSIQPKRPVKKGIK